MVVVRLSVHEYLCIVGCIWCYITRREHPRHSSQSGKSHVVDMRDREVEDSLAGELVDKIDLISCLIRKSQLEKSDLEAGRERKSFGEAP
jgi:hypothetical protein